MTKEEKLLEEVRIPKIVEELDPENTTKGINGSTFKIKLDCGKFSQGTIISYDKYHGAEMYITHDAIVDVGDGFIYTVQLINSDKYKFIENKYIQKGIWIMAKGSPGNSYSHISPKIIKKNKPIKTY